MQWSEVVARRRMVRSFDRRPVDPVTLDRLLAATRHAPSAGNTRGTAWVVLLGPQLDAYWALTTTAEWRRGSARGPALQRAPAALLSLCSPAAYLERYSEADKASSGLGAPPGGGGEGAWPVPYWFADAAGEVLTVLLGATDAGLAGCFLGNFRGEESLLSELDVPEGWRLFGTVLLGHPDGEDHPSSSLARPAPGHPRLSGGRWGGRWPPAPAPRPP